MAGANDAVSNDAVLNDAVLTGDHDAFAPLEARDALADRNNGAGHLVAEDARS